MLNNLMNRHDLERARAKLRVGEIDAVLRKFSGSATERVVRQWSDVDRPPAQWWSIPAVRRRWNLLVSGSEHEDFPAYALRRHIGSQPGLRALSLGCGSGGRELRWCELGAFEHIEAFDISAAAVEAARVQAAACGHADAITFAVQDFATLEPQRRYDVVLAEHSLHHLAPVPDVVARIARLLVPGGLFLVDEYIGPRRFQWSDAQVSAAQELLEQFPPRFRARPGTGLKRTVVRPSRLWMRMTDPSEAIDSARIAPALRASFDVVEERPYGGAVLHLALSDISQNFLDGDPETEAVLRKAFEFEDRLMAEGRVQSDFSTFVCRMPQ